MDSEPRNPNGAPAIIAPETARPCEKRFQISAVGVRLSAFRAALNQIGFVVTLLLLLTSSAFAQEGGKVSGVVVSAWDGSPLPNVTVSVRGTTLATQTDADGHYELKNVPPGDQVLRFSRSGFATAVITDARVLVGQSTTVNGNLRPEFYEMEEYEVTAEEFTEQTEQILIERQKSSAMTEALGSDFLSRIGAGNAAESISKVSGATIVNGKSAVIRGLNDRYVTTTLNGATIPSADPYRQSAALDLFPAQVIDRVVVAKTFTPDQPGTFTGGGIDIVTKSFPEKPFFSFSLGGAYNTQSSLNDRFLTYKGGGLDWAGMDDGSRALPDMISAQAPIHPGVQSAVPGVILGNVRNTNDFAGQFLVDRVTRELGVTEFAPKREAPPLNHNFSAAGGGSKKVFDGLFGYFAGVNYKHDYSFYENGVYRRYTWKTGDPYNLKDYQDAQSSSIVNWSGMVNLAYKPCENHELDCTFFYNQNGTDEAGIQDHGFEDYTQGATFRKFRLYYTERNLHTFQIRGEHLFPAAHDLKFNWLVGLTETTQDEPDARFFNDMDAGSGPETGGSSVPAPSKPTRYFRNLDENNRNVKLDWTLPFHNWTADEGKLKFGLFSSESERTFTDRQFYYLSGSSYHGDPNQYLVSDNLGAAPTTNSAGRINFHWFGRTYVGVFDSLYNGSADIRAGYLMAELPLINHLRLVGGARYEMTDIKAHSESYLPSSTTGKFINESTISQGDLLPAAGLIYAITPKMNLRLNYSQTVARPSFRELAAYYSYDPLIQEFIEGNPNLKMTSIENYDARVEWFPNPGEVFSASIFYKNLRNAIERGNVSIDGTIITFMNRDKAKLYGMEFEARKNLEILGDPFKPFSLGGNVAFVKSEVNLTRDEYAAKNSRVTNASRTRPLYDQSPYILNLDLDYNNTRSGTTASLVFNVTGPSIILTQLNAEDVYRQPSPTLDFVCSQKIGRHATVKFTARNLFDSVNKLTYGKDSEVLYSSHTWGRTFSLSFSYDF